MAELRRFLPNGCGTSWSPWVPDAIAEANFAGCCGLHDLSYHVGGIRGGIIPWRIDGHWRWEYAKANTGLSICMARRIGAAAGIHSGPARWLWRTAQGALPAAYWTATMAFGWVAWSWRARPMPTADELAALAAAMEDA